MKTWLILFGSLVFVSGCGAGVPEATSTQSPAPVETTTPTPSVTPTVPSDSESPEVELPDTTSTLISGNGIGPAQLGTTLGELKQRLGTEVEFTVTAPFMVDFDAIAVSRSGELQFYILYLAGEPFTDSDTIQGLWTENPSFQTAEGVGPGTAIQTAEDAYGEATLSYNTENESREYVRFDRQPAPNISFGTGNGNDTAAGIYPSPGGGYNETQQYREDATIESVLLVCLDENCAGSP